MAVFGVNHISTVSDCAEEPPLFQRLVYEPSGPVFKTSGLTVSKIATPLAALLKVPNMFVLVGHEEVVEFLINWSVPMISSLNAWLTQSD